MEPIKLLSAVHACTQRIAQIISFATGLDQRRVRHSLKVGLALAVVSLTVLLQDVFEKVGHNALWAVVTVVVVFEYTVGATLSKGLNRGLGTTLAALLGLGVDYVGNFLTARMESIFVGCSVFLIGTLATYVRFVPSIKARYDYGALVFLLTFCMVVVSSYRVPDSLDLVFDRVITIIAGVIICLIVSIFIFPIWAGDDLHKLVQKNAEELAASLEECLKEYFNGLHRLPHLPSKICKGQAYDDNVYKRYQQVLVSKQNEESLANFATWEPRRGRFGCMYPWKRLMEVGAILRHCAYTVSALHGCLLSEIQVPNSLRKVFADPCMTIGHRVASVLREVADDIRKRQRSRSKEYILAPVRQAVDRLHYAIYTNPHLFGSLMEEKQKFMNDVEKGPHIPLEDPKDAQTVVEISPTEDMAVSAFHHTMAFAESLSIGSVISLLIEFVARLDNLTSTVKDFQEEAGFKKCINEDCLEA